MTTTVEKALREALAFYADEKTYISPSSGFCSQYDPVPPPIREDRGAKAREALLLKGKESQ